ncbi:TonB-dependent receptor [Pseudovibrio sp. JE062]|uniref:TonB-dependent receptor n=1 Tax=Pseudovibrio sp. JE062 TaxID=439495 RepID=UPI000186F65F|nr:STN domain-containing protein [Pseudovibrio sp. JE062]EEA93466.1 TonB-dependent receptor domain protein [Pseudovibrio sp. JE062]
MHLLADILGKKNTQRLNGNSVSHLLVTALLGCSALTTGSVVFNQHVAVIAQEQSVSFSISAQPLSSAIREFIATTGWQISYSSDAVAGKRSSGVSGNMSPEAALRKLISGTGLQLRKRSSTSVALLPFGSKADASADSELLDEVVVYANTNPSNTESLFGDGDPRAIGKTTISRSLIETGGDAGGDINSQLKTLPNVQWQNHTSTDAGDNATNEQDLRPGQYSISGADVNENLFILDGIGITSRGAGYDSEYKPLQDRSNIQHKTFDGLHSQTVYVPDTIVDSLTVQDSNVSARHGGFQGGVVEVKTIEPTMDRWSGFASIEGSGDSLAKFNIATKNGDNPLGRDPYKFLRLNGSIGLSGPISEGIAFLSSISNNYSHTSRKRAPQFVDQKEVETATHAATLLNKLKIERDWGVLSLSNTTTFYNQNFESDKILMDNPQEIIGDGTSTKLQLQRELDDVGAFSNISLDTDVFLNTSKKGSIHDGDVFWSVYSRIRSGDFQEELSDKCIDVKSATSSPCNEGGFGEKTQSEIVAGGKFSLEADWKQHRLSFGGGYQRIFARREQARDLNHYSAVKDGIHTCVSDDDPLCYVDGVYANNHTTYFAYETNVALTELNLWAEAEFNWGDVQIIPGVRIDHESYLQNTNLAPRLAGSWTVNDRLTFTAGFNRYYDDTMLAYALKSGQPGNLIQTRKIEDGQISNEVGADGGWTSGRQIKYDYSAYDLKTPYNDEYTVGASITDPFLNGTFRTKYLQRKGRDRFSLRADSTSLNKILSNDGSSKYESISVEYAKSWSELDLGLLNSVGFKVSASWAKRHTTNVNYFSEAVEDKYIYYNGKSYTEAGFDGVRGNLDIPIRGGLRLQAGMLEERFNLWASANFTLPYDGVKYAGSSETFDAVDGSGPQKHKIYEDHHYDFTTYVNAGASFQLAKTKYGETVITAKIDNVFNEVGHATATESNPFKKGRQFWLGLKTSF